MLKVRWEITPGIFLMANRLAMAVPIRLVPVVVPGWMFGFTGSENGGRNILAQAGDD